jgi:hypothetical protein
VPLTVAVKFTYGEAEVTDAIGNYMIKHGFAEKHRLVLSNRWDR